MSPCSKGTNSKQFLFLQISNCHNNESIGCFRWGQFHNFDFGSIFKCSRYRYLLHIHRMNCSYCEHKTIFITKKK